LASPFFLSARLLVGFFLNKPSFPAEQLSFFRSRYGAVFRSIPLFDPAGGKGIIPSSRSIPGQHVSGVLSPKGPKRSEGRRSR
jgi:hypothetical protein